MINSRISYFIIFLAIFVGILAGTLVFVFLHKPQITNTESSPATPTQQVSSSSFKPVEISPPIITPNPTVITSSVEPEASTVIPEWVIVFTYSKTPLPDDQVSNICNNIRPIVISWIDRELNKYQKIKPFDTIKCLQNQVLLSGDLLQGGTLANGEGRIFQEPINDQRSINYLENEIPDLVNEKYVTVFYYVLPTDLDIVNQDFSSKYDFEFITSYGLPNGEQHLCRL